jgi:hypothetical protein
MSVILSSRWFPPDDCQEDEDNWLLQKLVSTYQTERRHIPEGSNLTIHCPQDLKSHTRQITDREYPPIFLKMEVEDFFEALVATQRSK